MTPEMEQKVSAYIKALEQDPYSPPSDRPLDPELLGVLAEEGKVVRVNDSVVFAASAYQEMTDRITEHLKSNGSITVAEARTMFDTSRLPPKRSAAGWVSLSLFSLGRRRG